MLRREAASGPGRFLEIETLAAAAGAVDVRILEFEHLLQAFAHEVEPRAIERGEALGVDDDLRVMRFECLVTGANVVRIIERIRETRAADLFNADAQSQTFAALGELCPDLFRCVFSQCDCHRYSPFTND